MTLRIDGRARAQFCREIEESSGEKVSLCYQCGKCTAGCPVAYAMDYTPNQVVRMAQLGMRREVLGSKSPWLCSSCFGCATRCPMGISITRIMDAVRIIAQKEHVASRETTVPAFNRLFLRSVKRHGRLHELGLIVAYNLSSGQPFKDFRKGPRMLFRTGMRLLPVNASREAVRRIFSEQDRR